MASARIWTEDVRFLAYGLKKMNSLQNQSGNFTATIFSQDADGSSFMKQANRFRTICGLQDQKSTAIRGWIMADICPYLGNKCKFFDVMFAKSPTIAEQMKKRYTEGKYNDCHRYQIIVNGDEPPSDLWPSGARTHQV
jgi:hypothetical protein